MQLLFLSRTETEPSSPDDQNALEYFASIWNMAEAQGVTPEHLSEAAIRVALATLVESFGEDVTAEAIAGLPERIRSGDFTLRRYLQ